MILDSCSPDPTTNSETTNPEFFPQISEPIRLFLTEKKQ